MSESTGGPSRLEFFASLSPTVKAYFSVVGPLGTVEMKLLREFVRVWLDGAENSRVPGGGNDRGHSGDESPQVPDETTDTGGERHLSAPSPPTPERRREMDGVERIAAERRRQIESEGWTPEHDDKHVHGELAISGAAYAWPPDIVCRGVRREEMAAGGSCDWKPGNRIRELEKAGALIAAEIDRLQRQEPHDPA